MAKYYELTPEEEKIIINKGTEIPGTGEYDYYVRKGLYICRQCNQPLYRSDAKFISNCGWPSFEEDIAGRVKRIVDRDGHRTEIICYNCGAHLGHVFEGEGYTEKNTRHCVNSISMKFIPDNTEEGEENIAVLGGGCFWCLEAIYKNAKGILSVESGYSGGESLHPTYDNINGHAEVIKIVFDPEIISYETILEIFFAMHDPTQLNRQGNDMGPQYRSIILYQTLKQEKIAKEVMQKFSVEKVYPGKIVTELKPLVKFHQAESYHQDYYKNNPDQAYCQAIISPKVSKFRQKFKDYLN